MAEGGLRFVPPRVQMVDERGIITREWYLFFQGVFDRIGGATGQSSTDLTQDMPDDAGLEETKALLFTGLDGLSQGTPMAQTLGEAINQDTPMAVLPQEALSTLIAELQAQRDLIAELTKMVQAIQQGTMI